MNNAEGVGRVLHGSQRVLKGMHDRFFSSEESKERKIIQGLPPVVIRLFGDVDYEEQLKDIPEKFHDKIIVLTTCDTSSEAIARLEKNQWNVVQSSTVTDQEARENSGMLLNKALRFGRENNIPYMFFLSSGFQSCVDMFYSMYTEIAKKHPHQDAYYFILPETHIGPSIEITSKESMENIEDFLLRRFPFETALILRTDFVEFETKLSHKGSMGTTKEGVPLGGMEFFLTLLDRYKKTKDIGEEFSPHMVGITFPVLLQRNGRLLSTIEDPYERRNYEVMNETASLQVTSSKDKLIRRVPTWCEAIRRLDLSEANIRRLFSATSFENGLYYLTHFID